VISIFRYLQDKDVFEDFYKQHLAGRLLSGPVTDDVEKSMIAKLKAECGHQFTSRLEGMFRDMDLSKAAMRGFKDHEAKAGGSVAGAPELSVTVLTTGFWPIPTIPDCNLPRVASIETDKFTNFYTHLHSGRRLAWQTSLGTAELRCKFAEGKVHELLVHTYQVNRLHHSLTPLLPYCVSVTLLCHAMITP
jgi:cullin 3